MTRLHHGHAQVSPTYACLPTLPLLVRSGNPMLCHMLNLEPALQAVSWTDDTVDNEGMGRKSSKSARHAQRRSLVSDLAASMRSRAQFCESAAPATAKQTLWSFPAKQKNEGFLGKD